MIGTPVEIICRGFAKKDRPPWSVLRIYPKKEWHFAFSFSRALLVGGQSISVGIVFSKAGLMIEILRPPLIS
jgi:hypothetical protein